MLTNLGGHIYEKAGPRHKRALTWNGGPQGIQHPKDISPFFCEVVLLRIAGRLPTTRLLED